ncbi:uncharacterized protein LOC125714603 [Brienomyrus brachyistius]|uniref:uncharacterized protein LOC125714603 n=1 Tax=Brienomyrus brachyistius TaxID=42636 RepID=UPI0020B18B06|nr:uncharacterized protein LOC125714603 [Brienomyrus brachyistius]
MNNKTNLTNVNYVIYGCICLSGLLGTLYIYDVSLWDWRVIICGCLILVCPFIVRTIYFNWNSSPLLSVKVHVLVAGETFQAHETFIQKLKLQIELCSAESSNVILLFCPVVSRIGTDMEAAMDRVTVKKPVIRVFMHHCHKPSDMTNITVQPSRGNIVQVVHCAFLEYGGLLQCSENNQAVSEVRMMLQKYQQGNGPSTEEISKSV